MTRSGRRAIDRFGEQIAPEEREQFEGFADERVGDWRVVEEHDPDIAVQDVEASFEPGCGVDAVAGERSHLRFAEVAGGSAQKAATEALDTGDSEFDAVQVDGGGGSVEHRDPGIVEELGNAGRFAGVMVVVAEHGDDRDRDLGEFGDHATRLVVGADLGQISGEE